MVESYAQLMAPVLSSRMVIGPFGIWRSSVRKLRIHAASAAASFAATYSASVVFLATTGCILLSHVIGHPAMKNTYPVTDLAVSGQLAKLESTAPNSPKSLTLWCRWSLAYSR